VNHSQTRVILSGVPSWAEEAEGTSGGWWTGEQAGWNGVEGPRRAMIDVARERRGPSTALRPLDRLRFAQDDTAKGGEHLS